MHYTYDSYAYLIEETSQGNGKHLEGLFSYYGCKKNTHNELRIKLRERFFKNPNSFSTNNEKKLVNAREYLNLIDDVITSNDELLKNCHFNDIG